MCGVNRTARKSEQNADNDVRVRGIGCRKAIGGGAQRKKTQATAWSVWDCDPKLHLRTSRPSLQNRARTLKRLEWVANVQGNITLLYIVYCSK